MKNVKAGLALRLPWGDELNVELRRGQEKITVTEVWEIYEPVTRQNNRSFRSDIGRSKHFLRHLGKRRVTELTLADIEEYRIIRSKEQTPRGNPPSLAQLNLEVKLLRRSINYAVDCGHLSTNPLARVKMLTLQNVRQATITRAQFERLLEVSDDDLRPILLVAYDTGMRKNEILQLKWSQVDPDEGAIVLSKTKTDEPRTIYLTTRVREELARLPRSTSGYVFVNPRTNKPWVNIEKKWRRARKSAGIDDAWFHDHRRSFVTNARRDGVPESVLMKMIGDKTRSVFDRYNVVSPEDMKNAVAKIEGHDSLQQKTELMDALKDHKASGAELTENEIQLLREYSKLIDVKGSVKKCHDTLNKEDHNAGGKNQNRRLHPSEPREAGGEGRQSRRSNGEGEGLREPL